MSGRETLPQLVFVLALHFVQHLDGSPPGHGQPVQTHCCSYLQPQRWPTSAPVMSTGSDDEGSGSSPLAAPAAAAEDARAQAPSQAGLADIRQCIEILPRLEPASTPLFVIHK